MRPLLRNVRGKLEEEGSLVLLLFLLTSLCFSVVITTRSCLTRCIFFYLFLKSDVCVCGAGGGGHLPRAAGFDALSSSMSWNTWMKLVHCILASIKVVIVIRLFLWLFLTPNCIPYEFKPDYIFGWGRRVDVVYLFM